MKLDLTIEEIKTIRNTLIESIEDLRGNQKFEYSISMQEKVIEILAIADMLNDNLKLSNYETFN